MTEIFNCDECGDQFVKFTIDPHDEWDFYQIIGVEGVICKGCTYKLLMENGRLH